jgi:predicted transcriptional regulator
VISESCLHLLIYKHFKQKASGRMFINYSCAIEIMRRRFREIPRALHYETLHEMEELGLIRRTGNTNSIKFELIGKNRDNKINKYLGVV